MRVSAQTSQKIKNMGLLCAILIVTIHIYWPHDAMSIGWFMHELVANGIARIAVPFFFMVSGFFFAGHFGEVGWWKREVGKRLTSLGIPYLAWSGLNLILALPLCIVADVMAHREFGTSIYWLHGNNWVNIFGLDLTCGPDLGPLWYVRCLMIFVLLGWVFKKTISTWPCLWLFGTFLLDLSTSHLPEGMLRDVLTMGMSFGGLATGILYFSVGIFLYRYREKLAPYCKKVPALCTMVGVALLITKVYCVQRGWLFQKDVLQLAIPFLIYGIWNYMPPIKVPHWLTSSAFPIFLMNIIFITIMRTAFKYIHIDVTIASFAMFATAIVASIVVSYTTKRHFPKIAGMLFGGR